MFFFQLQTHFVDDALRQHRQVDGFFFGHIGSFLHAGQQRDVAQQMGQPVALGIASHKEGVYLFPWQFRVVHDGFQVALNAADGCLQFVCDVLGQLFLQACLLGFLGNIVDGNLEAVVLKNDTFQSEDTSVFLDVHGCPSHFLAVLPLVLGDEAGDRGKFGHGKDFLHLAEVLVGNEVDVLLEQQVDQYFFFVLGKYSQSFV